jgi:glucose/arabinose dehydrogenase
LLIAAAALASACGSQYNAAQTQGGEGGDDSPGTGGKTLPPFGMGGARAGGSGGNAVGMGGRGGSMGMGGRGGSGMPGSGGNVTVDAAAPDSGVDAPTGSGGRGGNGGNGMPGNGGNGMMGSGGRDAGVPDTGPPDMSAPDMNQPDAPAPDMASPPDTMPIGQGGAGGSSAAFCDDVAANAPVPTLKKTRALDKLVAGAGQVISPPGEPGTLYILDHFGGGIYTALDGKVQANAIASVNVRQNPPGREQGLLSIAFHPNFASNQLFFVFYSADDGTSMVDVFKRTSKTASTFVKNFYTHAHSNDFHNGGQLAVGPDKLLYLSMGDNRTGGDAAKTPTGFYGRILRFNPDTGAGVAAPGLSGFTWDYGLRNPYRISFDRKTGDLWIGDVGESTREEIDFEPAGQGGKNWGWTGGTSDGTGPTADTKPVATLNRTEGKAIVGGHVYRGQKIPGICGRYFFGDNNTGNVYSLVVRNGTATPKMAHTALDVGNLSSFGEDANGEMYMSSNDGQVYRIDPGP